ncbi:ABC transporter, ATP-binding protein (cluster 5, nickel/peptides/opines) / ABC transporter, ATP-binding protein (cluster 5, nickel/peptides/opines) [hydrothermal vent metagenome]|uniref:ABC transporter, ATP-binding protein (Cluster 5, nickel/peptides/opines) / ABC transporter, ATP-binding protein (Cluster 5, nickel/peptides/opines) n=1 Tax=hydrothermal vent metagenome TaxID=652676 RepID=A0A3B0ZHY5_9ZZZZ
MDFLLNISNLKTYLKTSDSVIKAVDDVSFAIKKGETFCLVGESGSGKSICALSIIQLLPNDISSHPSGAINFNYRHNDGNYEQLSLLECSEDTKRNIRGSRIAMIFQEPMTSLNPVLTIGEQIIEAIQLHFPELTEQQKLDKTLDALRQVQIPDPEQRITEYPHRLSGGQRQRVMIAMAMVCEPDLLIADEPTTALDVTIQAEILQLMQDLQKAKAMSILFITHDLGVVSQIADRVAVMRLGKIVELGDTKMVLNNPQHDYTRKLLAALPERMKLERDKNRKLRNSSLFTIEPLVNKNSKISLLKLKDLKVYFPVKKGILRHTVDHIKAVDGIDLNISKGEILALVGESGCGKTTLGRAILKLIEPTAGSIEFSGRNISKLNRSDMKPYRKSMQVIFQDPMSSLNPRLTIATTLTEPMAVHKIGVSFDERIEIARETLRSVQLDPDYLWRYPHEFSGGQKQRIGIARALVLEPEFIVCDEVTSALDVSVQSEILDILLELRSSRQLTLLFITHNISVVEYLSDSVAVMNAGKIVEYGQTEQVCSRPANAYTKRLMDAVPRIRLI